MRADVSLSTSTLYGFLLVLARIAGAFVFVPFPGASAGPQPARIMLALALTVALYPSWPAIDVPGMSSIAGSVLAKAALGLTIGLAVAFLAEALLFGAQIVTMQAGFGYASMVDPATQADSSVLVVFAQLAAGLLFFTLGLDREILRILARSLVDTPPGSYRISPNAAAGVIQLGGGMLQAGLRLALPVLSLVALVDLSLAVLGRLQAQLQLLSMAFPAKILTALLLLSWMTAVLPRVYLAGAGRTWAVLEKIVAHAR